MRNLLSTAAAAALLLSAALSLDAQAFPAGSSLSGSAAPDLIPVAGGCGGGWHRAPGGACVPNGAAVVVPPVVVAPGPAVVAPAVVAPPVVCGPGFRWHPRWRRCVVL
jgi:hypothetical protein